ncbi:glycosyltransferase family 2 protein [Candidatus Woesearchaeota archaeon]|nr:glycosyltransferase family 2 protein [Candidatus Woesearchaeota archaeon]
MAEEKIVIVIPAHNEAINIGRVVAEAIRFAPVIVIDDGSRDSTAAVAQQKGAKVLKHAINLGKGAALKTGCDYAVKHGFGKMIVLDADTQHDPGEIPKFIESLKKADVVFGFRKFSAQMPLIFRLGNFGLSRCIELLFGAKVYDTQCGYRAFTKDAYRKIRWDSSTYSMETEMIANMGIHRLRYEQVPIKTIYADRYKGTTIIDGIKILGNMLWWRLTK